MAPRKSTKRRPARKGRKARNTMNVQDKASCSVTRTLTAVTANTIYSYDSFCLADFDRAVQIAEAYQRYRIVGIKVTWKPTYDTYSPATPNQKPFLYAMVDRSGAIPDLVTLEGLKQCGAKPRALDEKPLSVMWRPAVLGESRANAGIPQASNYMISPLLSTNDNPTSPGVWNASRISHQGLKWYIEQAGVPAQSFTVEVEAQFEFFKPLFPLLSSVPAKGLEYAVLDQSPDGVEGGTDGITIPLQPKIPMA